MKIVLIDSSKISQNGKIYADYFNVNRGSINTFQIENINDRPYVFMQGENGRRHLRNDIHEWFESLNAEYSIHFGDVSKWQWYIEIPDEKIATLFKLTWC